MVLKQTYDLNRERPTVILMGNGFNLLIEEQKKFSLNNVICKYCEIEQSEDFNNVPFPLMAMVYGKNKKTFLNHFDSFPYVKNTLLKDVVSLEVANILTTNYTYEIENVICEGYSAKKNKRAFTNSFNTDKNGKIRLERATLLKTYTSLDCNGLTKNIWHIHGELRNRQSVIIRHDEYERLVSRIYNYLDSFYKKYKTTKDKFVFESWIDYLMLGNIYIIGLGLDFSEYDLWWLLNKRNEFSNDQLSECVFYEPYIVEQFSKHQLLDQLNIRVEHLNCRSGKNNEPNYTEFYKRAIKDIKNRIGGKTECRS